MKIRSRSIQRHESPEACNNSILGNLCDEGDLIRIANYEVLAPQNFQGDILTYRISTIISHSKIKYFLNSISNFSSLKVDQTFLKYFCNIFESSKFILNVKIVINREYIYNLIYVMTEILLVLRQVI